MSGGIEQFPSPLGEALKKRLDELEQKIRNIEAVNQLAGYLDSLRVNAENAKQFIAKEEAYLAEKEML